MSSEASSASPASVFRALGHLYTPADDSLQAAVIEADKSWSLREVSNGEFDVIIWGRLPLPPQSSLFAAGVSALRREMSFGASRLRSRNALTVTGVHRLEPPKWRHGIARNALRSIVLGGAVVELSRVGKTRRVLDAVIQTAQAAQSPRTTLRPSYDGSALGEVQVSAGVRAILRVAANTHASSLKTGALALRALEDAGVEPVPRLLRQGEACGSLWTTESAMMGARPRKLTKELRRDVTRLCSSFPVSDAPATSVVQRFDLIAQAVPNWRSALQRIEAEIRAVTREIPSVLQHGDLWTGNLLVAEGKLSGLVDWDSWHPAGLPGVDLLHLLIGEHRLDNFDSLGQMFLSRPWTSSAFEETISDYWRALGLVPDAQALYAIGIDWWASRITSDLRVAPWLKNNEGWLNENVVSVLQKIEADL